ncbi:MAG: CAP domain-containing protein [Oscillospiraceae bacterium]|nr:CAP domain-containing protein [Oscillospiraceae bacterium]
MKKTAVFLLTLIIMIAALPCSVSAETEFRLNRASITLAVGEEFRLRALGDIGAIKWELSDYDVISISLPDRTVFGEMPGTSIITATNNGKDFIVHVTVKNLRFKERQDSISVNESMSLTVIGETGGASVVWSSSDAGVASVDSKGVITGIKEGKARITAAVSDDLQISRDVTVTPDFDALVAEAVRLTNQERAKHGLPPLSGENLLLNQAAKIRAEEITTLWSHTRPDGRTAFSVLTDVGLKSGFVAENIYAGFSAPNSVISSWMNSQGHRNNILNADYKYLSVGVAMGGDGKFYWVQLFCG